MISEQEQERFMRLWTDAQPAVVNYLHAMVRDPAMAKDLVQETAMVLFRRFARHEKRRGAGRAATHPRTTPRLHRATNAPGKAVGMSDPQKLIAAYLDDALSDADRDELVAWLKGPPDHLRAFVEANLFEQQIRQAVHGQVQREAAMHFAETSDSPQPKPHRIGEEIPSSWIHRLWLRLVSADAVSRAVALAACVAVLAAGFAVWFKRPSAKETTSTAVAMLARAVDARWGQSTAPLRVGGALEPGWLRLESGLAQVDFYSGARVVIEGPAQLRLVSPNEAACPTGRLLAQVPRPARGFRLKTDQINLVDLGTTFGIDATHGRTEVHVFKGKVELLTGTAAKQALGQGQAARAEGNAPLRLMAASATAFTPMFQLQQRSLASESIRYDQWRLTNMRLNSDPSLVVHLAVVLDGKARQIVQYVNGAPVSRHELKLGPPFRLGPSELGNWNARSDPNPAPLLIRNFSGSLDEFALFNRALTDAQVRELYTTGKPDE